MRVHKVSRRELLKAGGAAGGLLIFGIGPAACTKRSADTDLAGPFEPNVFVSMSADGAVEITVSRSEMGQGVRTSLPRIVADELEADLERRSRPRARHSQTGGGKPGLRGSEY
jgi:isoquinoline 1-oxidoreductase beta subunit